MIETPTGVPGGFPGRIPWSKTDQEGGGREVPALAWAAKVLEVWLQAAYSNMRAGLSDRSSAGDIEGSVSGRGRDHIVEICSESGLWVCQFWNTQSV